MFEISEISPCILREQIDANFQPDFAIADHNALGPNARARIIRMNKIATSHSSFGQFVFLRVSDSQADRDLSPITNVSSQGTTSS